MGARYGRVTRKPTYMLCTILRFRCHFVSRIPIFYLFICIREPLFTTLFSLTTTHPHFITNLHTSLALWLDKCELKKRILTNRKFYAKYILVEKVRVLFNLSRSSNGQISPSTFGQRVPLFTPPIPWHSNRCSLREIRRDLRVRYDKSIISYRQI